MKIIIDRQKMQRRAKASHAASLGGMVTILASVAISMWKPQLSTLTAVLLFLGFAVATVGVYFANRWVKKPRPEDVLDHALKGLDDRCRLYHYLDHGLDHVLLTTSGLVILETRGGEGVFEYRDGHWHQKITMGKAIRFFVEEALGDPVADGRREAARLTAAIKRRMPSTAQIPVHPLVVFTHPAAEVTRKGTPIPVCQPKQLRSELPRSLPPLSRDIYEQLREILDSGGPY